ncbi:hypothetical protein [Lacunisphaera limnophila]|nr:hypothetical protein [Lacunisphaera limnophila]
MKTKFIALTLAAATAFAFTAKPAVAGDKELAVVGGLIGGLIIASAISDHDTNSHVVLTSGYHRDRDRDCEEGYWKRVEVRSWVPGYWVSERRHGRTHRYFVEGHYEIRTDRIWVSYDRRDRRDRRDYDRGYGRDRDYRR